jgi:hypothetical protein
MIRQEVEVSIRLEARLTELLRLRQIWRPPPPPPPPSVLRLEARVERHYWPYYPRPTFAG